MKLDSIEHKVVAIVRKLDKQPGFWSDKKSTRRLKDEIGNLGERLGYEVYAAECRFKHNGEWLYDLCWCRTDQWGLVLDLPLALESEWNSSLSEVLCDFQKLVVSRATHRVFLCYQPTAEDWADCVEHLIEQIRLYTGSQKGDRYLLGCWSEKGFSYVPYTHPTKNPHATRVWLFQANPDDYPLYTKLKRRRKDYWHVQRNLNNLRPGNIALLWQSGNAAGIYGYGKLTSRTKKRNGQHTVDIRYHRRLKKPVLKQDICSHPVLKGLGVIAMPRGQNPFRVLDRQWKALTQLSRELGSISSSHTIV